MGADVVQSPSVDHAFEPSIGSPKRQMPTPERPSPVPGYLGSEAILRLQRSAGNAAVTQLLQKVQRFESGPKGPAKQFSLRMESPFAGGQVAVTNVGPLVQLKTTPFRAAGSVEMNPDNFVGGEYELGFMQAITQSSGTVGHYYDADGNPIRQAIQRYGQVPVRDGDGNSIWYGPEAMVSVDTPTASVSMGDAPQVGFLADADNKSGTLQQTVGTDSFVTWLVLRHEPTRRLTPLGRIGWGVDWSAGVDPAQAQGTPFGVQSVDEVLEGQGASAPMTSGPVANNSKLPTRWEPWS